MNIIESCVEGKVPEVVKTVAKEENVPLSELVENIIKGYTIVPQNKKRRGKNNFKPIGIGKGLRVKVNANIGSSSEKESIKEEIKKLEIAIKYGADTVMDLSTGVKLKNIRREILKNSPLPVGTVPIYQVACEIAKKGKDVVQMEPEHIFSVIEEHAEEGVDFITVHCGVTRQTVEILKKCKRTCGIVSRGGAFLAKWITYNNKENPLYEQFDKLLDIAYKYDLTLSLGDGLRPGAISDATDRAQVAELMVIAELVKAARKKRVQVMVEGPGHVPLHQIEANILLAKYLTDGAPFYVLGPLVTDIAVGYDHIAACIGGAVAAMYGADFLCYVTPREHIGLPTADDVKEGVIAARIAAHAADIARGIEEAVSRDKMLSEARKKLSWEKQKTLALVPEIIEEFIKKRDLRKASPCSMCGEYCALRISSEVENYEK